MCKQTGLDNDDLEIMTVGACLDYFDVYVDQKNPDKVNVRQATQDDFDNF